MKYLYLLPLLLIFACTEKEPEIIVDESDLIQVINDYREENGLDRIPESPSLNMVAEMHVIDLAENYEFDTDCNLHSWSDQGEWSACCYTSDHAEASCMWDKPKELTNYTGAGFEIAAYSSNDMTSEKALDLWKNSIGHNNVVLNIDKWENSHWKAIGAAIYDGYAVVWFGAAEDPELNLVN